MSEEKKEKLVRPIEYVPEGEEKPLIRPITYVPDNEPIYLILLIGESYDNDNIEIHNFELKKGRQKVYDYVKDLLVNEEEYREMRIDVSRSKVLCDKEGIQLKDYMSVYNFMKQAKERNKIEDDTSFDIDNYLDGEDPDINILEEISEG